MPDRSPNRHRLPERVGGLILEASPTTLKGDGRLERFVADVVSSLEDPIDPEVARSLLTDTSSDQLPPQFVVQLIDVLVKIPARVWKEMFAGLLSYDDLAEVGRISVPTLLVWGDGDGLAPRDTQLTLAERIRCAQLRVYPRRRSLAALGESMPLSLVDVAAFVKLSLTRNS